LDKIEARHRIKPFTGAALAELQRVYAKSERAKKGPLFNGALKPEDFMKFMEKAHGNPEHGRTVFTGSVGCATCHRVEGKGGEVGPELTGVAAKYNRTFLVESVLYPSKQILDGYKSTVISTKDGESYTGFVRSENSRELTLLQGSGAKQVIKKDEIEKREEGKLSLMPEGLQAATTLTDFADLISYLETLKENGPKQKDATARHKATVATQSALRSPRLQ
jgi:putative heme-binding domain-containing protein